MRFALINSIYFTIEICISAILLVTGFFAAQAFIGLPYVSGDCYDLVDGMYASTTEGPSTTVTTSTATTSSLAEVDFIFKDLILASEHGLGKVNNFRNIKENIKV